jgi:AcrR family transcriptional regulator
VRRTRTLLRTALVELIEERGFDRLTVGELTERAMVSRAAFYRNYNDKFHLVEQIFDEAIVALVGTMSDDDRSVRERWTSFFEHISTYHRLYGALLGRSGSPWFANRMRATLAELADRHVPSAASTGLVPTLISGMFVQSITWWLENDRPMPPHEIAGRSAKIAAAIIAEANGWPEPPAGR